MGSSFSGSYASGVILNPTSDNPAAILSGATLDGGLGGGNGTVWTISNAGVINFGVAIDGRSIFTNDGTVSGAGNGAGVAFGVGDVSQTAFGTLVNAGTILGGFHGAYFTQTGTVTNQANALIEGYYTGVRALVSATVSNAGMIESTGAKTSANGIYLSEGGRVTNVAPGATIEAPIEISGYTGVRIGSPNAGSLAGDGTVQNSADIRGVAYGVYFYAGGTVVNATGGSILPLNANSTRFVGIEMQGSAGTVLNSGAITGSTAGIELVIGTVSNAAAGAIVATLAKSTDVEIRGGGTVRNDGTIRGGSYGALVGGGLVTNGSSAVITASGTAIAAAGAAGTVLNDGTVGGGAFGVVLGHGGSISNALGARITASGIGVQIADGGGTVENTGTIGGTSIGVYLPFDLLYGGGAGTITNAFLGAHISGGTDGW